MSIKVLLFASLREEFGLSEVALEATEIRTVSDVWNRLCEGRQVTIRVLNSVNMEYAEPDAPVSDGDEVAFFPPVTGGGL